MNRVYYIVGKALDKLKSGLTGGHGYCYDINNPGKKRVQKDVATTYGYFVNADHQTDSVIVDHYLSGRTIAGEIGTAFLKHLELILRQHIDENGSKLLIVTSMPKLTKSFIAGNAFKDSDEGYFKEVYKLYEDNKSNIIFDLTLYPKGGLGPKYAHNQLRIAEMLMEMKPKGEAVLNKLTEKEFSNPDVELNPLVTASRWFFNTGDASKFYDTSVEGYRHYCFGRVEPDKNYYGKATPDVYYSILYTKEPLGLLDRLYDFCKDSINNDLNRLFAGNLNNIKSKDVSRTISDIPGEFKGNELISPMKIGSNDSPCLVEYLNPPGLAYRVTNFIEYLGDLFKAFKKRDIDPERKKVQFKDITDYFFDFSDKKPKLKNEFSNTTIKIPIPVECPGCVMPVKINLSVSYDCPNRNSLASLLKNKVEDIKIYLALDFNDPAGVSYCTIVSTPDFEYIHSNSISNLRVYSLKELGRQPPKD